MQRVTVAAMERDAVLNIRLPAEVKDALQRAADLDERSLSVMAVRILRRWLEQHGHLPAREAVATEKTRRRTRS